MRENLDLAFKVFVLQSMVADEGGREGKDLFFYVISIMEPTRPSQVSLLLTYTALSRLYMRKYCFSLLAREEEIKTDSARCKTSS